VAVARCVAKSPTPASPQSEATSERVIPMEPRPRPMRSSPSSAVCRPGSTGAMGSKSPVPKSDPSAFSETLSCSSVRAPSRAVKGPRRRDSVTSPPVASK
jgi:hypothetical protein